VLTLKKEGCLQNTLFQKPDKKKNCF